MEGVTTAIVGFIFVCVVFPRLVRNRPQYYAALAAVLLVILLQTLVLLFSKSNFVTFANVATGFLQVGAIMLLVLGCGGVTASELASDIGKTIEVVRRGGERETIIVPLTGEQPKVRD